MVSVLFVLAFASLTTSKRIDTALSAPKLTGSKTGVIILFSFITEGGEGIPFEEIAQQFSSKREDTTPNPPFLDEKSVFEEEAPSTAQRRQALDFYNDLASLFERQQGTLLTPLDIVELHYVYLEALRASIPQGEIVPEYTLTHVIGASKRLVAYAEVSGYYESEEAHTQDQRKDRELERRIKTASRIEATTYPLVPQQEAIHIQQSLWEEARELMTQANPWYQHPYTPQNTRVSWLQVFPEEHPNEAVRTFTRRRVVGLIGEIWDVREGSERYFDKPFGVTETIAYVTKFGHDDSC